MICIISNSRHSQNIVEKLSLKLVENKCPRNQFNFYESANGFFKYGESSCVEGIYVVTEDAFWKIERFCPEWEGESEKQDEIVKEFLAGLQEEMIQISL